MSLELLRSDTARRRWMVAAVSALLIAIGGSAGWLWPGTPVYLGAMLAATVVAGYGIARRALIDLRNRVVGIELLVTIAVIGAILIEEVWEAAAVTFLFQVGGALEALTLARTRKALGELIDLAPTVALVLRNGEQVEVDPSAVQIGERVLVKAGGKVAVDGTVLEGAASIDEASITGESMPVEKTEGDPVYAGTVVADGTIVVATSRVGTDTTLARIIHRVEEAQEAKAPAQRFMERFARRYTPAVVALAAGAFAVTGDLELALTLLVIGCPGALVISIPVSIVAGIGRAARRGILVEGGDTLETTGKVTTVAFDKTGTLTSGRPRLTDVMVLDPDHDEGSVLRMAAAVETMSEHPVAVPIVDAARQAGIPLPDTVRGFVQHAGRGVEGLVDAKSVLVGTPRLMREVGIQVGPDTETHIGRLADQGKTALMVAAEGEIVGILAVADTVRPGAAEAVASLLSSGVDRIVMLTGDSIRVARRVGAEVGVDEIRAGLLPEDKLDAIRELQESGETVAMVGDGVNDAPAMATADVGIAMGAAGSDVAIETASMTLMSDRLDALVEAIILSRRTTANLHQNVAISVLTVVVLLAGVLAGQVHMAGGMLVHQASVLLVILNAIRLMRSPLPGEPAGERAGSTPVDEVARTGTEIATP